MTDEVQWSSSQFAFETPREAPRIYRTPDEVRALYVSTEDMEVDEFEAMLEEAMRRPQPVALFRAPKMDRHQREFEQKVDIQLARQSKEAQIAISHFALIVACLVVSVTMMAVAFLTFGVH